MDVGVHGLFKDCATINEMLEVQVLWNVFGVFLTGDELVAERHVNGSVVVLFEGGDICLITDFDTHFAVAVGLFLNGHNACHRIELIYIFL